jgi:NADH:ubiquinone oxidoreductase subunit F (NADH-binding)
VTVTEQETRGRWVAAPTTGNRLFAAGPSASYSSHIHTYGELDAVAVAPHLVDQLIRSGLTGRGGAGFSVARKVAATSGSHPNRMWAASPVVIANGAEGEPRSIKDETLLRNAPHLVIDGLLALAAAIHAKKMFVYVSPGSLSIVERALAERRDARAIVLVAASETFVSGEASAVVNAIENGVALPRDHVVRLSTSGYKRRPTLVHNVETLAHVALIARFGADWFRSVGSDRDPGTRLVTVSGAVSAERVLEVAGDARLDGILAACGGSPNLTSAVLVGGYHGVWIPGDQLDVGLSPTALAPFGGQPGAGVLYVLGKDECGLAATADIVRYLASQSAQQCGPCMFGLPEMAGLIARIASGSPDRELRGQLESISQSVVGRGACHHPDGTSRLVLSALTVFARDVEAHLSNRCTRVARISRAGISGAGTSRG